MHNTDTAVNWGVLGVSGHFIKRMRMPWQRAKLSFLYALASRNAARAKTIAESFHIPRSYGSYEELLEDKNVHAVFIPLPNHLHLEWIRKCADAGKHVLCEKPICLNAPEAQEAVQYCEERGVLLMEAFMYKFHPRWQYVRELLRSDEIGDITTIQTSFFYYNDDEENIRFKYREGGGALYDIGCYGISSARFIMGAEPERVISLLMKREAASGVDTHCSVCMDFGNVEALFTVGTRTWPRQQVQIFGKAGHICVDLPFNAYHDVMLNVQVTTPLGSRTIPFAAEDQYLRELEAFSYAVLSDKKQLPVLGRDAINNMAVIDAVFASEKQSGWVPVAQV